VSIAEVYRADKKKNSIAVINDMQESPPLSPDSQVCEVTGVVSRAHARVSTAFSSAIENGFFNTN
jgi:hypothetical protein